MTYDLGVVSILQQYLPVELQDHGVARLTITGGKQHHSFCAKE